MRTVLTSIVAILLLGAGQVAATGGDLTVERLVISGVLLLHSDTAIRARDVIIERGGVIAGIQPPQTTPSSGEHAEGARGNPGVNIFIDAERVVVEQGAWLVAGYGGDGAAAVGRNTARGGDGGSGGSIYIRAPSVAGLNSILAGAGGDGGHASAPSGTARGGDGGASSLPSGGALPV